MNYKTVNWLFLLTAGLSIVAELIGFQVLFAVLKPLTTALMILLVLVFGDRSNPKYYKLTLIALLFCCVGDGILLNSDWFIFGLLSFLLAHIFFFFSFVALSSFKMNWRPLVYLILFAGSIYLYLLPGLADLKFPVAIYITMIVLMSWQGIAHHLDTLNQSSGMIFLGVLLFMLSDSILAINRFQVDIPYSAIWILSTYWLAIYYLANAAITRQPEREYEVEKLKSNDSTIP